MLALCENRLMRLKGVVSFWLLGWLSFSTQVAEAEMDYHFLKGVHHQIKAEAEFLSPIYGFSLLESGTLANLRFYGNFGPALGTVGCLSKGFSAKNDCPRDFVSKLIQRFFPVS